MIDGQKIEVKTQNSIPNKHELTIELYYDLDSQPRKKGWFFRSEADYFIFYDQVNRKAYKIKSYHLQQYIDFHIKTKDLEFRQQFQYTKGYGTRTAELCFIPIE